jgi:hypothetical protein
MISTSSLRQGTGAPFRWADPGQAQQGHRTRGSSGSSSCTGVEDNVHRARGIDHAQLGLHLIHHPRALETSAAADRRQKASVSPRIVSGGSWHWASISAATSTRVRRPSSIFQMATPTGPVPMASPVRGWNSTAQSSNSSRSTTSGLAMGLSVCFTAIASQVFVFQRKPGSGLREGSRRVLS